MKRRENERGSALMIVIFALAMVLLLLTTTLTMALTGNRTVARQLVSQGQATSNAQAGLTEGLSWFVHQRQQPVKVFDPVVETTCTHVPAHDPLLYDSEDPEIGLVRSFEVASVGKVWGRYEVRRNDIKDVSADRDKPAGTVWSLVSEGMVYVRNDKDKAPNVPPNFLLAKKTMRAEIQRLGWNPPANAALSSPSGKSINVISPSKIVGGSEGIGTAYPEYTGTPSDLAQISGTKKTAFTKGPFDIQGIFGVSETELIGMADVVVQDEKDLPVTLPGMSIVVVRGNATFNGDRPLQGSGILIVLGNLIVNPQANAYYNGIVWVKGQFTATPPGIINGMVIANGNTQLTGGNDIMQINYDPAVISQVTQQMGNYLFTRTPWSHDAFAKVSPWKD